MSWLTVTQSVSNAIDFARDALKYEVRNGYQIKILNQRDNNKSIKIIIFHHITRIKVLKNKPHRHE